MIEFKNFDLITFLNRKGFGFFFDGDFYFSDNWNHASRKYTIMTYKIDKTYRPGYIGDTFRVLTKIPPDSLKEIQEFLKDRFSIVYQSNYRKCPKCGYIMDDSNEQKD